MNSRYLNKNKQPAFIQLAPSLFMSLLLSLCLLTGLIACDMGENNLSQGLRNQVLHLGNGTEPQDIDPHTVTGVTEHNIIRALFEGLVNEHPQTLAPVPGVAERWKVDKSGKLYTFYLRKNARWSNGDPVTANDFIWSWKRLLLPSLAAEYAYQLFVIENAQAFYKGEIKDFSQVGVKAIDKYTLQVKLTNPTPYFLSLLAHFSTFPVHAATVLAHGDMDDRGTRWTRAENMVGNGPFTLEEWRLNYIIRVVKSQTYWDKTQVQLNEIRFYPIDNAQTEERMFRTGALHVASSIPPEKIAPYQQHSPDLIHISPYLGTYFYRFNVNKKPLNDARVRRALALTIDRDMLVSAITKGGQLPAYTLVPPGLNNYRSPKVLSKYSANSITEAQQLLAAAGYPNGDNFPVLELLYNTGGGHRRIAVAVQQMWKQHLSIDIQLSNQDWKVYLARVRTQDYDIARAGWIGDYLDPNTFLDMFMTNGGNNRTGWSNTIYDNLITAANSSSDQRKRLQLFNQAEALLLDEMPILPIYIYTRVELRHPQVNGWWPNIQDHHPYQYIYLQENTSSNH